MGRRVNRADLRQAALERAGYRCEWRGCALPGSLELAHLKGVQSGGSRYRDDLDNVAILCQHHHDWLDGRTTTNRRLDNEEALRGMLDRHWAGRR